ncbi:hypothetical protein [Sphingobacterium corticibacter]|uniref:CDP-glycerol--glycerophosphate glycerophosphotransferase n=1 Tax=Sphingobacterium corticibacter TaxID=2171749 RepID=A0A2T8HJJ6_9SPHI|nr:hypothetical protein [Sphingobacterium corticibacter]PVH25611.1 hypothetical protein DC487_06620 [Sphingobacterium corticibacter]
MMDKSAYDYYKKLKCTFESKHNGYDMKPLMANFFLFNSYSPISKSSYTIVRQLLKICVTYDFQSMVEDLRKDQVVFFYQTTRNDYFDFIKDIISTVDNTHILPTRFKHKFRYSLKNIISSFKEAFSKKFCCPDIKSRVYYFACLTFYKNVLDELDKHKDQVSIKSFVGFNCSLLLESLFCQFFQACKIPTYGLQHGVLLSENLYSKPLPMDFVNLENFQADYLLGWGDFTKRVFDEAGYNNKKCIVAGNPKYAHIKQIHIKIPEGTRFIVCLARDLYTEENKLLINIVAEMRDTGYSPILKLHPNSDISRYRSLIDELDLECADVNLNVADTIIRYQPDFTVVYNSTIYYEYYLNNLVAFRFSLNEKDIPFGMPRDSFSDCQDLIDNLNAIKERNIEEYNEEINLFVNQFVRIGANDYNKILNN